MMISFEVRLAETQSLKGVLTISASRQVSTEHFTGNTFRLLKMATSRAVVLTFNKFRYFPALVSSVGKFSTSSSLHETAFNSGYTRDPGEVFFSSNVQSLLLKLTGKDYEKVFHNRKLGQRLEPPKLELLTEAEVDQVMNEMEERLKKKLQMPPLLKERDSTIKILSKNPELQGFDDCKYVFIDISQGIPERKRDIVVRDPDGTLREASREERHKMSQIFLPAPGRQIHMPKMFEDSHLVDCLSRGEYEFVLDRACTQFEPDDTDYIRVTRTTFDHIDENGKYAALRSTRHFGPMVLHLVLSSRLDGLLFHFICSKDITAASDLVRLFHTVESGTVPQEMEDFQLIENYIQKHALKKPALELAWQSYLEIEKQQSASQQNKATN